MPSANGYDEKLDGPADKLGKGRQSRKTAENLAAIAEFEGNLAERMKPDDLKKLGEEVCEEFAHDEKSREEWTQGVDRALKNARQKPEKKNYPFEGASNIKYPVLTKAAVQFNARCSSAIFRGEQPMTCKVLGSDPAGQKAKKGARLTRFGNHQLMYLIDEWSAGTDKLTLMLPVMGSGFRKGYWRQDRGNPALEFTSAKDVVVPNDAPSFDRAPRMTQPCPYYPYEIDRLVGSGKWLNHKRDYEKDNVDTQKACIYLEQVRYIDLDGDGMMEPYIVTVAKECREVVRIDAAFWANSIRVNSQDGSVETIMRESPWIDYTFIPDIDGSVYGMGFGQFLESIGSGLNTALNQIFDAAHRQNAGGGFISQGLRLRGGEIKVRPAEFLNVNVPGRVSDAIHELAFNGPSPVLFQLVEFLLGAADDITSVKDVMTGEAPSGQAMGATLALIEQGQQVLSTIYERIYRSMRKEFRLLFRLNERYLDPQLYAEFLDDEELFAELMGMPSPEEMAAQQQAAPPMGGNIIQPPNQKPPPIQLNAQGLEKLVADFDLKGMDVAPSADPRSFTDMQRMMKAQYLEPFKREPGMNPREIQKRQLNAANIEDVDKLFLKGPSPLDELNARGMKADVELKEAQVQTEKQKTVKTAKEAEKTYEEAATTAFERGVATGMAGGVGGVENAPDDGGLLPQPPDAAGAAADGMDAGGMGIGGGPAAGPAPPA